MQNKSNCLEENEVNVNSLIKVLLFFMKKLFLNLTLFSSITLLYSDAINTESINFYYELVAKETQTPIYKELFFEVEDIKGFIQEISKREDCPDNFHILNLSKLDTCLELWKTHLPSVEPYYAVKTNHDLMVVAHLADLGLSFDCASAGEIKQVLDCKVDPSKIVFSHPRKQVSSMEYARDVGIQTYVFDSIEELNRMKKHCPHGQYLLRITTNDQYSSSPLSQKFGASIDLAKIILDQALADGINVCGIAFHVGSNCWQSSSYTQALEESAELFKYAKEKWDVEFNLLDIGGGWPGGNDEIFIKLASSVEKTLAALFEDHVKIIAEPGRFFAAPIMTTVMSVLGKSVEEDKISYYLSDGIFGLYITSLYYNYNSELIAKEGWNFKPLNSSNNSELIPSRFWGVTCDSSDKIYEEILFPEVDTGDYIYSENMGAYTHSVQTNFNQIPHSLPFYVFQK